MEIVRKSKEFNKRELYKLTKGETVSLQKAVGFVFDVDAFVDKYYTEGTTNLKEIFASEADMLGIQKLIDEYIAAKHYLSYQ